MTTNFVGLYCWILLEKLNQFLLGLFLGGVGLNKGACEHPLHVSCQSLKDII